MHAMLPCHTAFALPHTFSCFLMYCMDEVNQRDWMNSRMRGIPGDGDCVGRRWMHLRGGTGYK